jgi:predicted nucleotidyltransferase
MNLELKEEYEWKVITEILYGSYATGKCNKGVILYFI